MSSTRPSLPGTLRRSAAAAADGEERSLPKSELLFVRQTLRGWRKNDPLAQASRSLLSGQAPGEEGAQAARNALRSLSPGRWKRLRIAAWVIEQTAAPGAVDRELGRNLGRVAELAWWPHCNVLFSARVVAGIVVTSVIARVMCPRSIDLLDTFYLVIFILLSSPAIAAAAMVSDNIKLMRCRIACARALCTLKEPAAIEYLIRNLRIRIRTAAQLMSDSELRRICESTLLSTLPAIGPETEVSAETVQELCWLAHAPEPELAIAAVDALGLVGTQSAVRPLEAAAARGSELGSHAERALATLGERLRRNADRSMLLRPGVPDAGGLLRPAGPAQVESCELLRSSDGSVS
ncbi:MAG TPA: hypothetical protein VGS41_17615 [Chthonomonadales bacterium]|nr:hypothetical protein [Chthonomonadales bacterium]